jgi:hypothetical protein
VGSARHWARLAVSRGSRRRGPASHAGLGRGQRRDGPAAEKAAHDDFSNLNPFSN